MECGKSMAGNMVRSMDKVQQEYSGSMAGNVAKSMAGKVAGNVAESMAGV